MKNKLKIVGGLLATFVFSFCMIINARAFTDTTKAFLNPTGNTPVTQSTQFKVDKAIPSAYNFYFGSPSSVEIHVPDGVHVPSDSVELWKDHCNAKCYELLTADKGVFATVANKSKIKNNYYAIYHNIGKYNDKSIDVKVTVLDYEALIESAESERASNSGANPIIVFYDSSVSIYGGTINWIKIKAEFLDSNTKEPVSVKGNASYFDVDLNQGILFDDNSNKGFYTTSESFLKIGTVSGKTFIYDNETPPAEHATSDKKTRFSEIFEGSSITRTFKIVRKYYNSSNQADGTTRANGGVGFSGRTVVPMELESPVKSVNANEVKIGEEYVYTVSQKVNSLANSSEFSKFEFTDELEPCLLTEKGNITVENENGDEVTNIFDITVDGQKIKAVAKSTSLGNADFYGHTYNFKIKTSVRKNYNLSPYLSNGVYVIPNKGTITTDVTSKDTNIVNVKIVPTQKVIVPATGLNASIILIITGLFAILVASFMLYKLYKEDKVENK